MVFGLCLKKVLKCFRRTRVRWGRGPLVSKLKKVELQNKRGYEVQSSLKCRREENTDKKPSRITDILSRYNNELELLIIKYDTCIVLAK